MPYPNTLIFVDFPSDDPEASAAFYAEVFGWEVEGRPDGRLPPRSCPAGTSRSTTAAPSPIGNLHIGIYDVANARPHPDPAGVEPRQLSDDGRSARVWILVSDDDTQDAILDRGREARRHGPVARPLLGRVQRLQRRVRGSVGQHHRPVDARAATTRRSPRGSPVSDATVTSCAIRSAAARWTHIALPCTDIDASIDWYETLHAVGAARPSRGRRRPGRVARPPRPGRQAVHPRARQLLPRPGQGSAADHGARSPTSASRCRARRGRRIAAEAEREGCLYWPPTQMPRPIGYICALTDPDGNVIEFSYDQGVYDKAQEVWGNGEPA